MKTFRRCSKMELVGIEEKNNEGGLNERY